MIIQSKRGTKAKVQTHTGLSGEPLVATDTQELFIGDGSTPGGFAVGTVKSTGTITADSLAVFSDTTGRFVKPITKATLLSGLATDTSVDSKISTVVPTIKVQSSAASDVAANATKLGNVAASGYIKTTALTDSYSESTKSKVVTAFGIDALRGYLKGLIDTLTSTKLDKSSLSSSTGSSSTTTAATSAAVKATNDKITTLSTTVSGMSSGINDASSKATTATNQANTAISKSTSNKSLIDDMKAKLPDKISQGTVLPSGGSNGDVYIQYS